MSKRILIVEDNAGLRRVLKTILAYEGYAVETAEDGLEAFETLQQAQPNMILLDVMLPGMDGLTLIGEMKTQAWWPVPTLVMTANPLAYERAVALVGVEHCILKPFESDEVRDKVRELIGPP